jgi:protein-tyrosine-phosphatase
MDIRQQEKRNVTSKQAIDILRKNGVEINEKKAEELLELMYFLAELIVNHNFKT